MGDARHQRAHRLQGPRAPELGLHVRVLGHVPEGEDAPRRLSSRPEPGAAQEVVRARGRGLPRLPDHRRAPRDHPPVDVEEGPPRLALRDVVEVPAHRILEARSADQLQGAAVEADDAALGVGEHDPEVEGVEGLPPLLGGVTEVGFQAALPLLRLHALGHVADGADAHGSAVQGQRAGADLDGHDGAVRAQGSMLVRLLGLLSRCDRTRARSSSATNCSTGWPTRSATSQPRIFAIWSLASTNAPASVMAIPSKAAADKRLNRSLLSTGLRPPARARWRPRRPPPPP